MAAAPPPYGLFVDADPGAPGARARVERALRRAGVGLVGADPAWALDEVALRAPQAGAPLVVVVGPGVEAPAGVGRRLHQAAPQAPLVFLRHGPAGPAVLAHELASPFACVGASWRVLPAESDEVAGVVAAAVETGRRRQRLRTTLDRINVRLETRPPADASDLRHFTVSHAFLEGLLATEQDGIIAVNDTGTVVLWNPGAARLFGREARDVLGRPVAQVCGGEWPARMPPLVATLRRTRTSLPPRELACQAADGTDVHVEVSGAVVEAPGGDPVGVVLIARDVGPRRRLEAERTALQREVLRAQKRESLNVMAGGIAHEFNNLLTVILGHTDLAVESLPEFSPGRQSLEEVRAAARRAADLSLRMLAYSGHGTLALESVRLTALVDGLLELVRASSPGAVAFELEGDEELPAIEGAPAQLRQLVLNLVTNGIEALGDTPGRVLVRTRTEVCDAATLAACQPHHLAPGVCVLLQVSDSGPGMDPAVAERAFDPFFTTRFTGRGLGLPEVQGIVRGHGGAVRLVTAPGRGTTVTVYFPAADRAFA